MPGSVHPGHWEVSSVSNQTGAGRDHSSAGQGAQISRHGRLGGVDPGLLTFTFLLYEQKKITPPLAV